MMGRSLGPLIAALLSPEASRYLAFLALAGVILVGIGLIVYMRREAREPTVSDADLLAQFEAARASGEMDEAEFQRVSAVLKGRTTRTPSAGTNATAGQATAVPPPPPPSGGEAPVSLGNDEAGGESGRA